MSYCVYRFLNSEKAVVYVGKTKRGIHQRMNEHFGNNGHLSNDKYEQVSKIEYIEFSSQIEMDIAELYLINLWKPIFNTADKLAENVSETFIDFSKYEWAEYDRYSYLKAENARLKAEITELKRVSKLNQPKPKATTGDKDMDNLILMGMVMIQKHIKMNANHGTFMKFLTNHEEMVEDYEHLKSFQDKHFPNSEVKLHDDFVEILSKSAYLRKYKIIDDAIEKMKYLVEMALFGNSAIHQTDWGLRMADLETFIRQFDGHDGDVLNALWEYDHQTMRCGEEVNP